MTLKFELRAPANNAFVMISQLVTDREGEKKMEKSMEEWVLLRKEEEIL